MMTKYTRPRAAILAVASIPLIAVLASPGLYAQAPANAATQVASNSNRASWFSDRRTFQEGEVVSIVIDEFTLVAAGATNRALDQRRSEGLLTIFPSGRNGLGSRGRDESDLRGSATRDDRLRTEVSVRIAEVHPSGTLRLEGRKVITIDKHNQEFVFRGWARPQDILLDNVIEGWRVADLELLYVSNGELQTPKKGLISKLIGILF